MKRQPSRKDLKALFEAQDLVFDAWDTSSKAKRVALAKKALAISDLCADAYGLLAGEEKHGSDKQADYWRKAVAAGEAALGSRVFEEDEGYFWGLLETRPYMRAKEGLAWALWERKEQAEALQHARDMLKLNPTDNQGIRYALARWLYECGERDELGSLLEQYKDDSMADWTWTRALTAFRKDGDSPRSRSVLAKAMKSNPHVAGYLLGKTKLPKSLPPYYSPGEADEAAHYVYNSVQLWAQTKGALDWLLSQASAPVAAKKKRASKPGS